MPARGARAPAPAPVGLPLSHPALWGAVVVAAAAIALSVTDMLGDTDLFQHLTAGKAIWQLHEVPLTHLWTWPSYGKPDVLPSWLFAALIWPLWAKGGVWGLFAWRWATTLGAFALLWATARRLGGRGLSPLLALVVCALVYRQRTQMRPETLVAVLLALELWVLESGRKGKDWSWWLVGVALVWANAHISYYMGFVLLGVFAVDAWISGQGPSRPESLAARARAKRLGWVALAAVVASFVNPFGGKALAQPFEYFFVWRNEEIYRTIRELGPIEWAFNWRNGLPLVLVGWPLLQAWRWTRGRRLDRVELMLCTFFSALVLLGQRFVGFYALVAAPYLGRDLEAWLAARRRLAAPPAARALLTALACVAVGLPEWTYPLHPTGVRLVDGSYPEAACDFMAAHGVRGRGFNQYEVAGYQLYRFWPERDRLPFIDIHQSGSREDRRAYAFVHRNVRAWGELDQRYHFDYALLDRSRIRGNHLLDFLDADTTWALVFVDDTAALYLRRDGPLAPLAARYAYALLPGGATRVTTLQRYAMADTAFRARLTRELMHSVSSSPYSGQDHSMLGDIALLEGRWDDARRELERSLAIDRASYQAHQRLGLVALVTGDPRTALAEFEAERRMNGMLPGLALGMGRAYSQLGESKQAADWYRRALKQDPGNQEARDSLEAHGMIE